MSDNIKTTDPFTNAARTEAERIRRDAKYLTPAGRGPLLASAATAQVRKAQAEALREAADDIVRSAETLPDMTPHDAARGLVRRADRIEKED